MRRSRFMNTGWRTVLAVTAGIFVGTATGVVSSQEKPAAVAIQPARYDLSREMTLVGKVVSYSASSAVPPQGLHVGLQTASGVIDMHRGDARLLEAKQLSIKSGDTLRIIGEELTLGSQEQIVARRVQKGTQTALLRSASGFPLSPAPPNNSYPSKTQGGLQ